MFRFIVAKLTVVILVGMEYFCNEFERTSNKPFRFSKSLALIQFNWATFLFLPDKAGVI